ncbi:MAG: mechanosensitive ion channel [Phycisphaerales bacterium]|nr:mechanosensitive ion channel [Phycisphaerales bacterium]
MRRINFSLVLLALGTLLLTPVIPLHAQANPETSSQPAASRAEGNTAPRETEAERITRLRRTIEQNQKLVAELQTAIEDEGGDYAEAETEFQKLDEELEGKKKELEQRRSENQPVGKLEEEIAGLQEHWQLARDRFNLAIQERKTQQEQLATIQRRIQQDREVLDRLLKPTSADTQPATAPPPTAEPASTPAPSGETTPAPAPIPPPGGMPPAPAAEPASPPETEQPLSAEALQARQEAEARQQEAEQAAEEVRSVTERIKQLEKTMALQRELLETARQRRENARETERTLNEQVRKMTAEGADQAAIQETWERIAQARQRISDAEREVLERVNRIDALHGEHAKLQAEHIAALERAELADREAEEARQKVRAIENPFSLNNMINWLLTSGMRILGILAGMFGLLWLLRRLVHQLTNIIAARTQRGSLRDRENRAQTLSSVFHHTAAVIIIVAGSLMILSEIGIDIVPLMGGVAVVGLAVAFGAQNLIRDYFYGFMIILENQYGINDVVRIGNVAGLVERINLRITVLRDLEGVAHFVPNGEIKTVSNMTHGWSRVVLDIGVAYQENSDEVMRIITAAAMEVRNDPRYSHLILDDPEMLGLDSLGDSSVVFKMIIKTRALQQWTVKRAMLYQIKKRFDEAGIDIPFPQRRLSVVGNQPIPVEVIQKQRLGNLEVDR